MNFFDRQDQARRATRWLVVVYVVSTLLIVAGVTFVVAFGLTGLGIQDDILYGPAQVRALVDAAAEAGVAAAYREIRSTKGHDAFLVEWSQLATLLREALASDRD